MVKENRSGRIGGHVGTTSKATSKEEEGNDDDSIVLYQYLHTILTSVQLLGLQPNDDDLNPTPTTPSTSTSTSCNWYLHRIARGLLDACRIDQITLPIGNHLPVHIPLVCELDVENVHSSKNLEEEDDDERESENHNFLEYKRRRIDYVRLLLRGMGPIAIHVAAYVTSMVVEQLNNNSNNHNNKKSQQKQQQHDENELVLSDSDHIILSSFVLFSIWLPIAPHITTLVTNLFQSKSYVCPLEIIFDKNNQDQDIQMMNNNNHHHDNNEQQQDRIMYMQYHILEAAYHICTFYSTIRKETETTLTTFWDWSIVYRYIYMSQMQIQKQQQPQPHLLPSITKSKSLKKSKSKQEQSFLVSNEEMNIDDTLDENMDLDEMVQDAADDDDNSTAIDSNGVIPFEINQVLLWYSVRISGFILNLAPGTKRLYYEKYHVHHENVQWIIHPYQIEHEIYCIQRMYIEQNGTMIWDPNTCITCPRTGTIRLHFNPILHPYIIEIGCTGLYFIKFHAGQVPNNSSTSTTATTTTTKITTTKTKSNGLSSSNIVTMNEQDRMDVVQSSSSSPLPTIPLSSHSLLIRTLTTQRNLSVLGTALCFEPYPPPILVCGPPGSGKSCLIREIARLMFDSTVETNSQSIDNNSSTNHNTNNNHLLEIHVDDETDTKTLIGSYTATDLPGEFKWVPGAVTTAIQTGQWIVFEDLDRVPYEIQASLIQLFENRIIPTGKWDGCSHHNNTGFIRCHPNFRLFATMTTTPSLTTLSSSSSSTTQNEINNTNAADSQQQRTGSGIGSSSRSGSGKRPFQSSVWQEVHVEPLPLPELQEIAIRKHPHLPTSVVEAVLTLFRVIDKSGRVTNASTSTSTSTERGDTPSTISDPNNSSADDDAIQLPHFRLGGGRPTSVRDLFKVFARIDHNIVFETNTSFATESQRLLCLAECYDVFVAACPDCVIRRSFIQTLGAPVWGVTVQLATRYIETRSPTLVSHETTTLSHTEIGRARIPKQSQIQNNGTNDTTIRKGSNPFARTNYSLRLMESIGVCVSENEPVLLVGETGTGKTAILQELANTVGRELMVQNLSLQTDSADLLGGYRPLELQQIARQMYNDFVDLFTGTFSRKQNRQFLEYTATMLRKNQYNKLSQCFNRAAQLGWDKVTGGTIQQKQEENAQSSFSDTAVENWQRFKDGAIRFEQQRLACDAGLAFVFAEGALVDAIRHGKWILLDEINLASSETLQRICGLLDDPHGSLVLTERGDSGAIRRHPSFRLFAAMNPATDVGKKELNPSVRSRFTELYVDELIDPFELRLIAASYLSKVLPSSGTQYHTPPECTDTVIDVVNLYGVCRNLVETTALMDGSGQKPRYTMRTLTRALSAAQTFVLHQKLGLERSLVEGFELAFQGALDSMSLQQVQKVVHQTFGTKLVNTDLNHPGKRPRRDISGQDVKDYVLIKPFWIEAGPLDLVDWTTDTSNGSRSRFILTPTASFNLRRLARAIASGPWPILLEGPTSAGKTTLVEYVAARCGHPIVRINNHEHTDVQEYTGAFSTDSNGLLSFQDGLLVRALKLGHWVILDELNLAPSEVLEALNRLLDSNQELYIPEINEVIKPHPSFRLFATQNPSGAYGGRKPLSRAFRNRFVEIYVSDIPSKEMVTILEQRCDCPASHAKILVAIMENLRQRRSRSGVFLGKDGFITPRDLLRWAERGASSKLELAREGYMLLAERLRTPEEKECVREEIEKQLKVTLDLDTLYFGELSEARKMLDVVRSQSFPDERTKSLMLSIAPTKTLLRLVTLVLRAMKQKEPVLLVGDTGCGKTVSVQLLSSVFNSRLHIINCHQTTETSDLIGGLRPVRGRQIILGQIMQKAREFISIWPDQEVLRNESVPNFLDDVDVDPIPDSAVDTALDCCRRLWSKRPKQINEESVDKRLQKRQKTDDYTALSVLFDEIEKLNTQFNALFEWADGPLVVAMKEGDLVLLDEMSLADDAVLERLNSVLEPSKTIVLAEKAGVGDESNQIIKANTGFQLFATMNPGGDFGKRELSPALRSRFTEIWVPPVSDYADIRLVLETALQPSSGNIVRRVLEYVEWFNETLCNDPGTSCSELCLSLRDILTWSSFISVATNASNELNIWDVYYHGACLMHLDGLALGTGIDSVVASTVKQASRNFLENQISEEMGIQLALNPPISFNVTITKFGSSPFWIDLGSQLCHQQNFNFEAPTTTNNVFRVLRAMQLPKPILLEGSPGVGKTATITALAAASGHRLIRINLSEQTDISDLIGSDLPVPEIDSKGTIKAAFHWCDGVLLTAIKNGDWVLLDELNLASQSVLEGLNSCLDHRASIFIPELGKTFACPPTFRIFAAQNPLSQGGGRKGLPKSFLNRFTKVYVDGLSEMDLNIIVESKYRTQQSVSNMVRFNCILHDKVVERRNFGLAGAPWEFNLRDIFRWGQLLVTNVNENDASFRYRCARDLYFQRFRDLEDREKASAVYNEVFNCRDDGITSQMKPSDRVVTLSSVVLGDTYLNRSGPFDSVRVDDNLMDAHVALSDKAALEAVARCVAMKWPCLLAGNRAHEMNSIVRMLANVSRSKVVEIALSSSSDVSELIGCFEQVDRLDEMKGLFKQLDEFIYELLLVGVPSTTYEFISRYVSRVKQFVGASRSEIEENIRWSKEILQILISLSEREEFIEVRSPLSELQRKFERFSAQGEGADGNASHFAWKDGILVQAMTRGFWLHLKNVNLCPSSVLDRLNPVMEDGGSLLLAESAIENDEKGIQHREIKSHPNFRVFLSMSPEYGEVSRAMRNRCVEVSLIDKPSTYCAAHVDRLDTLWKQGIRCSTFASYANLKSNGMLSAFRGLNVNPIGNVLCALSLRGVEAPESLHILSHIFEINNQRDHINDGKSSPLLPSSFISEEGRAPEFSSDLWDARTLRHYFGGSQLEQSEITFNLVHGLNGLNEQAIVKLFLPFVRKDDLVSELRNILITRFLSRCNDSVLERRKAFFNRLEGNLKKTLFFINSLLQKSKGYGNSDTSVKRSNLLSKILTDRIPQLLKEHLWYEKISKHDSSVSELTMSVLETSMRLSLGRIEKRHCKCPLTPIIYPFFNELDKWIHSYLASPANAPIGEYQEFEAFLSCRDELWNLMRDTYSTQQFTFLGFEMSNFIVQWSWLRKCFNALNSSPCPVSNSTFQRCQRRLGVLMESIESILFGTTEVSSGWRSSSVKYMNKPQVPRTAEAWQLLGKFRDFCRLASVDRMEQSDHFISLGSLLKCQHPLLFIDSSLRTDVVGALSTFYLAIANDEGVEQRVLKAQDAEQLLLLFTEQVSKQGHEFFSMVKSTRIDQNIDSVDNQLGISELEHIMSSADEVRASHRQISHRLLLQFAKIQLAPCFEYICETLESNVISYLSRVLVEQNSENLLDHLKELAPQLRNFVSVAVSLTLWDLLDIRPYLNLLWIAESNDIDKEDVFKVTCTLLHLLFVGATRRTWANSLCLGQSLTRSLELPSIVELDAESRTKHQNMVGSISSLSPSSTNQDVLSLVIYSLIGNMFQVTPSATQHACFVTLENHRARKEQMYLLVQALAVLRNEENTLQSQIFEVHFLLMDVVHSLKKSFTCDTFETLSKIVRTPAQFYIMDEREVSTLIGSTKNDRLQRLTSTLVLPLLSSLKSFHSNGPKDPGCSDNLALAKIHLGLLRFHLLIPDSPLDPGRKPIAKMALIDRRLSTLGIYASALHLESGYRSGEFAVAHDLQHQFLEDYERLMAKRTRQSKNTIHRPTGIPSFAELFKEVKTFSNSILSTTTVLELVNLLEKAAPEQMESALLRESNWQMTAVSFCDRLLSTYNCYEDVVFPIVGSIGCIRDGLSLLRRNKTKLKLSQVLNTISRMAVFPCQINLFEALDGTRLVRMMEATRTQGKLHRTLAFSLLAQLRKETKLKGIGAHTIKCFHIIVGELTGQGYFELDNNELCSDEDRAERDFREQFPDHRSTFRALDVSDDLIEDVHQEEQESMDSISEEGILSKEELDLLCCLHSAIFSKESLPCSDLDRIETFRLSYKAAYHAYTTLSLESCTNNTFSEREKYSGHALALALSTVERNDLTFLDLDNQPDFHRDPNPRVALNAADVLENLNARLTQLANAFPGNDVLIAVARIVERIRKLDVFSASLAQYMTGLEAILRNAQDWEQHASDRVKIGEPLSAVSRIISSWRKLELQSWPLLLRTREKRIAKRAKIHWHKIYSIIRTFVDSLKDAEPQLKKNSTFDIISQRWVWKGAMNDASCIVSWSEVDPEELPNVVKALDTFLLTSPLGEFKERMNLLDAFAKQVADEAKFGTRNDMLIFLARSLRSLWLYYDQFYPTLTSRLAELRRPIETKLQQEMKLAKWDEQTFYAVTLSSERNHRKLMHLLTAYDEVLETIVTIYVESDLTHGVRNDGSTGVEKTISIPSNSQLFTINDGHSESNQSIAPHNFELRAFTGVDLLGIDQESPLRRLERLTKKMNDIYRRQLIESKSPVSTGISSVNDFCECIFERIDSLRTNKTTRPMKERALVELFRELKSQGYATTKWSIPVELRQFGDLFLLPIPNIPETGRLGWLSTFHKSSEMYYQRCLAEMHRLRTEVDLLGSKFITSRQLQLLTTFSEHGLLLLCQQRSLFSVLASQRLQLHNILNSFPTSEKNIPSPQVYLKRLLVLHDNDYVIACESIRELLLFLRSTEATLSESSKIGWCRDTILQLEKLVTLFDSEVPREKSLIVLQSEVIYVSERESCLSAACESLQEWRQGCILEECLPSSIFDTCLLRLKDALTSTVNFLSTAKNNSTFPICKADKSVVDPTAFIETSEKAIQTALLAIQTFAKTEFLPCANLEESLSIWKSQQYATKIWSTVGMGKMCDQFESMLSALASIHNNQSFDLEKKKCCVCIASDISYLYESAANILDSHLREYSSFYRSTAKLEYILIRVFRVLVSKGFCDEKSNDEASDGVTDNTAGMTFEDDKDGTGMGEGEGSNDVTDQLENEEQLLGLKDDIPEGNPLEEKKESKQLDKDEADKGMEMEDDFEGDMFDVPDKDDENQDKKDGDEEELEREMGDGDSPTDEVIDEKVWGDDDDEDENTGNQEEKFEEDNGTSGAKASDEMITKNDDAAKEENGKEQEDKNSSEAKDEPSNEEEDDAEKMNNDLEDNYEENHGINVRDEHQDKINEDADDMNLDEDMAIDGEDDDGRDADTVPDENEVDGASVEEDNDADSKKDDEHEPSQDLDNGEDDPQDEDSNDVENLTKALDELGNEIDETMKNEEKAYQELPKSSQQESHAGLGACDKDGQDTVRNSMEEKVEMNETQNNEADGDDEGNQPDVEQSGEGGSSKNQGENSLNSSDATQGKNAAPQIPNPLKNPGDASKFWHQKLNIIKAQENADPTDDNEDRNAEDEDVNVDGNFEYSQNKNDSTQALGEADENDVLNLDDIKQDTKEAEDDKKTTENMKDIPPQNEGKSTSKAQSSSKDTKVGEKDATDDDLLQTEDALPDMEEMSQCSGSGDIETMDTEEEAIQGNKVVSDIKQLQMDEEIGSDPGTLSTIVEEVLTVTVDNEALSAASKKWAMIQSETHTLARRLCEKLRLVMEPLVASKLRGDYRTGKRINMKRVIGYIASGYRKDKIWLRRTKPAKRNYRVLLAVDDSESMMKSGAGEVALRAMATLAVGMSQLEVGEVGIASFGNDMKLIHPFHQPFTSESGTNVIQNFQFNQKRTRTSLCVESAFMALESASSGSDIASLQLVFMISDGRIERDSRSILRRLLREMIERNILLVLIIVEGNTNQSDRIINMKEVSFEKNGKPKVKRFIEDYPFPYYIIIDEMQTLPEVLGDALRQWFEMLARLQGDLHS